MRGFRWTMNAKAIVLFFSYIPFIAHLLLDGFYPTRHFYTYSMIRDKSLMLKKEYKDSLDISVCVLLFYGMLETNL